MPPVFRFSPIGRKAKMAEFVETLLNPPEPNDAILEGMERYKSLNIKHAD
ncbi:hypothetical protein FACS1894167_09140 [Synergistales bacterium]|nr:hypothetical protein FACS1894167_09140 [Synergistales bacterium]